MANPLRVAIGCDDAALDLKNILRDHAKALGYEIEDFGIQAGESVIYPDIAFVVAESITSNRNQLGILVCGTGIGVAVSANKVPGIRAAQAHDTYSAQRARMSNDAQIVTIGSRVVGPELAKAIVQAFLEAEFQGGNSIAKVERIKAYEKATDAQRRGV